MTVLVIKVHDANGLIGAAGGIDVIGAGWLAERLALSEGDHVVVAHADVKTAAERIFDFGFVSAHLVE
jgi:hypothetical protein